MTEQSKHLRELTIMLINARNKDQEIERIYNFVIGIVMREADERKGKQG